MDLECRLTTQGGTLGISGWGCVAWTLDLGPWTLDPGPPPPPRTNYKFINVDIERNFSLSLKITYNAVAYFKLLCKKYPKFIIHHMLTMSLFTSAMSRK